MSEKIRGRRSWARRLQRREEAAHRQAEYDALHPVERLNRAKSAPGESGKEIARIMETIPRNRGES